MWVLTLSWHCLSRASQGETGHLLTGGCPWREACPARWSRSHPTPYFLPSYPACQESLVFMSSTVHPVPPSSVCARKVHDVDPGTHDISTCSPGSVFAWLTRQVSLMSAISQGLPRVTRRAPAVRSVNLVDLVCVVPAIFLCRCLWAPLLLFVSGVCHRLQCQL